jgi:3-oxoacyl-[acyl-carrier-protein] synthase-1
VVVCASSAWNGLAFSPYQTWALRRAEQTPFVESPFRCLNGARATMGQIQTLDPQSRGAERLVPIATRLLEPLQPLLGTLSRGTRIGVGVCLPSRMASDGQPRFHRQRAAVERAVVRALEPYQLKPIVRVEARGHAGLAFLLLDASAAFAQRTLEVVIVLGVDTYYDPDVVVELIEQNRLFDGENLDTFIPGEGGACLLLARRDAARSLRWPILSELRAAATGSEPSSPLDELPCAGTGLSHAALGATEGLREAGGQLGWWLSDMTSESYRLHEFQLAWPRVAAGLMPPESTLDFLPPSLGDVGAATLPTGIAIAIEGMQRGAPAARHCLVTASSINGDRGAVLIEKV